MNNASPLYWLAISLVGYVVVGQLSLSAVLWSSRRHISPPPERLSRTVRRSTRILWPLSLALVVTEEVPRRVREELKMRAAWVIQGVLAGEWEQPVWHCQCGGWGRIYYLGHGSCVNCHGFQDVEARLPAEPSWAATGGGEYE